MHPSGLPAGNKAEQQTGKSPSKMPPARTPDAAHPEGSRHRIWQAILELAAIGKSFTRQRLAGLTGLKFHVVDDHMDRLMEDGLVCRIGAGVFELNKPHRAEIPISITALDDGSVLLERGEMVLDFTPPEIRRLAKLLSGWAAELASLENQAQIVATLTVVDARTRKLAEALRKPPAPATKVGAATPAASRVVHRRRAAAAA